MDQDAILALSKLLVGAGQDIMSNGANTDKGLEFNNTSNAILQGIQRRQTLADQKKQSTNLMSIIDYLRNPNNPSSGTISSKGLTIKDINPDELSNILGGSNTPADFYGRIGALGQPTSSDVNKLINPGGARTTNPFEPSQSNLPDLTGLTTQDIIEAFRINSAQDRLNLDKETLGNQTIKDAFEMIYKDALTKQIIAETNLNTPTYDDPITGTKLTAKQMLERYKIDKEHQPNTLKEYNALVEQETAAGRTPPTLEKFLHGYTDSIKNYTKYEEQTKAAGKVPDSFEVWNRKNIQYGARPINIDARIQGKVGELKAVAKTAMQNYIASGDLSKDLDTHMNSKEVARKLASVPDKGKYEENVKKATIEESISFVRKKIISGGGRIISRSAKDGVSSWKVKWSDGDESIVSFETGEASSATPSMSRTKIDTERRLVKEAISSGKVSKDYKKLFKERTGEDY